MCALHNGQAEPLPAPPWRATEPGSAVGVGWWPRAIVAGFAASMTMLFGFVVAYGLALIAASAPLVDRGGAGQLRSWLQALTHNPVIDLGLAYLYAAIAIYFAGGLLWALLYGRFAAPHLRGPDWWRGVQFSVLPAMVSLIVVLPLLGAGFLGLRLGAGPLPLLGNLLLHALYGATLGPLYGSFGDLSAEDFRPDDVDDAQAMAGAERTAALGIVVGLVSGAAIGLLVLAFSGGELGPLLRMPPLALLVATILSGATIGVFVGSLVGLPSRRADEV